MKKSKETKNKKTKSPSKSTFNRSKSANSNQRSNRIDEGSLISDISLIEQQKQSSYQIYKLLRVKKTDQLRFSKKQKIELTKKFHKLSQIGYQNFTTQKTQTILNPNSKLAHNEDQLRRSFIFSDIEGGQPILQRKTTISEFEVQENMEPAVMKKMQSTRLMHKTQFREFFGLLGQGSNPFLSDRIFRMADQDQDNHINFEEFATIIDIYQNGYTEERNEFSFSLFDENQDGLISMDDMHNVMTKFMSHWSTLQGSNTQVDKEALKKIFDAMDINNDGQITLDEYKTKMLSDPDLFSWFEILNNVSTDETEDQKSSKVDVAEKLKELEQKQQLDRISETKEFLKFYINLQQQIDEVVHKVKDIDQKKQLDPRPNYGFRVDNNHNGNMSSKQLSHFELQSNLSPQTEQQAYNDRRMAETNHNRNQNSNRSFYKSGERYDKSQQNNNKVPDNVLFNGQIINRRQQIQINEQRRTEQTEIENYELKQTYTQRATAIEERKNRKKLVGEKKTPFQKFQHKSDDDDSIEDPEDDQFDVDIDRKFTFESPQTQIISQHVSPYKHYDQQLRKANFSSQEGDKDETPQQILLNLMKIQEQTQQLFKNMIQRNDDNKGEMNNMLQQEISSYVAQNRTKVEAGSDSDQSIYTAQNFINSLIPQPLPARDRQPTFQLMAAQDDDDEEESKDGINPLQANFETQMQKKNKDRRESSHSIGASNHIHKLKKEKDTTKSFIGFDHDNWNLMLHMIFGVSKSVHNCVHEEAFEIVEEDFSRKYCYELIQQKTEKTIKQTYQFFDFSPRVFHQIRMLYGISSNKYLKSIGPENIIGSMITGNITTLKEQCSTGKSGSFFYYTPDSRYMLKTISHAEFLRLKSILKQYYTHMVNYPQTMITRFYGLHKIKYNKEKGGVERIYFIIMANVFNTTRQINIRYDLKGSKLGRKTRKKETDIIDPSVALKDLDFDNDGIKIDLDDDMKKAMMKQIGIDKDLFKLLEINDYSLLLGICYLNGAEEGDLLLKRDKKQNTFSINDKINQVIDANYGKQLVMSEDRQQFSFYESIEGGLVSKDRKKIYFIGIIDTLTHYGSLKKLEYVTKSLVQGPTVSCIPPKQYGDRFYSYMKQIFQ